MKAPHLLALLLLLGLVMLLPRGMGPLTVAAIWVFCLVVLARSLRFGVLSFPCLYLLLLGLFHLGLVVPVALGAPGIEEPEWYSSAHLPFSLGLVAIAMVAFTVGAALAGRREEAPAAAPQTQSELFLVGLLVAAAGGALLLVGAFQAGVFASGYGAYYERAVTEDVRLFGFGLMLFPIGLLIAAVGATRRQLSLVGLLLAVVLGPLFLSGFRGPVIVQVASLMAVWAHKNRRLARILGGAALVVALVLAPAIRSARDLGAQDQPTTEAATGPLAVFVEAGGSLYPLVVTVEQIDGGAQELWWGRSYAMAVGRVLLNVSSRRSEERVLTPSAWATLQADPWAFDNGYGIGFSGVAEPYLNFGLAGVLLVFLALGGIVRTWERWLSRDPFRAAIGAASFGFVLWSVRNEAMDLFRVMAIASGIVLGAWALSALRRRWASRGRRADLGTGGEALPDGR
ncbi:MAG TPA: O-antigen polysaccharide polymerase Wzy [Myxococcales bacterium]|jgi:oligosaccharide repeat unit polymerase